MCVLTTSYSNKNQSLKPCLEPSSFLRSSLISHPLWTTVEFQSVYHSSWCFMCFSSCLQISFVSPKPHHGFPSYPSQYTECSANSQCSKNAQEISKYITFNIHYTFVYRSTSHKIFSCHNHIINIYLNLISTKTPNVIFIFSKAKLFIVVWLFHWGQHAGTSYLISYILSCLTWTISP